MGQDAQPGRSQRALFSIDWMLFVVAVIVLLFCLGAFIRITTEPQVARLQSGLLSLTPTDSLIAFEDFSFEAGLWSLPENTEAPGGLDPVLGPFAAGTVGREFQLPDDVQNVIVSFDLQLIGPWTETDTLVVSINETDAIAIARSGSPDHTFGIQPSVLTEEGTRIGVIESSVTPRPSELALPGTADTPFTVLRVSMLLDQSDETLTLQFQSDAQAGSTWTLDNLAIVGTAQGDV